MGKFGIGARVVDSDGDAGVIVDKRKGEREVNYDDFGCIWRSKSALSRLEKGETEYFGDAEGEKWVPKVGDRVRVTNHRDPCFGEVGTVKSTESLAPLVAFDTWSGGHSGGEDAESSNHWWVEAEDIELVSEPVVAPATTWTPKVGDKVRFRENYATAKIGDEGEITGFWNKALGGVTVRTQSGPYGVLASRLEPTPITAPLKIEAGRFYKTRDGRKVGPMVATRRVWTDHWGDTSAFDDELGQFYTASGLYLTRCGKPADEDLIAEWVEPAVAVAEATATLTLKAGATYRGASGALHTVEANPDNPSWPFKTAGVPRGHGKCRFWQADGTAYNDGNWNSGAVVGDRLVEIVEPPKFKVGGLAYCLDDVEGQFTAGNAYRISRISTLADRLYFERDDGGSTSNGWGARHFSPTPSAAPANPIPIGSTVTFTATGRLSAINENGHMQVTFPGLAPGQNSFALPSAFVSLAN